MKKSVLVIGAVASTFVLNACSSPSADEQVEAQTGQDAPVNTQLSDLAEILDSDIEFYDNFSPVGKQFDCAIVQLEDSLFGRFSSESESCIDWLYSFEPVVERLNIRLSNLPPFEDYGDIEDSETTGIAEEIYDQALEQSQLFVLTPICSDRSEWRSGELLGERCADLWSTKTEALDSLVSQRSSTWYDFIAEHQE